MPKAFSNILISLEFRHAENILNGIKTVELRRRKLDVAPYTLIWMYAKHPSQAVIGYAEAQEIVSMHPAAMWRFLGKQSAIEKWEFDSYFNATNAAHAILLGRSTRLKRCVSLAELRSINRRFNPPQFFKHLDGSHELTYLRSVVG